MERLHIEVQIGTNPIGVLSGKRGDLTASKNPDAGAREWVQRKYQGGHLKQVIASIFGNHPYQCVFVHGTMKEPRQLGVIESCGVTCTSVGELVAQAVSACERDHNYNRFCRATEIARLLATPRCQPPGIVPPGR